MSRMLSLADALDWLAARVESLDATPYQQDGYGSTWREVEGVLVDAEGQVAAHLAFSVDPQIARTSDRTRDQWGEEIQVVSEVVVTFAYHLRPFRLRSDQRLAVRAAEDVLRSMLAEWGEAVVDPAQLWEPAYQVGGEWLLNEVSVTVRHSIPCNLPVESR